MNNDLFEMLGLSPNEGKIYETLLERGESTIGDISVSAKIHRRNTYDAMQRLVNKGLCFQIFSTHENIYNAVDPDKLTEILAERQEKLNLALPTLKKKFGARFAPEEAYIYRGLEGQKNIWRDVIRVGQNSYTIGGKGGWFDKRLDSARAIFFKDSIKKKIKFTQIFDYEIKEKMPDLPKYFKANMVYRFLPKKYSTDSIIHIFGDYVVTYAGLSIGITPDDVVFFVIHSKKLAESYRTWFNYMWDQSSEDTKK